MQGVRQAASDHQMCLSIDKHRREALLSTASTPPHVNGDSRPFCCCLIGHPSSVGALLEDCTAFRPPVSRFRSCHRVGRARSDPAPRHAGQRASQPGRFSLGPDRAGRVVSTVGQGSERGSVVPRHCGLGPESRPIVGICFYFVSI
jgi:hypothetical protein